ncbi:hypothetical protein C2G38_2241234 [Gigaspora rosea]|uniref:Uncharacterized protein n=1 Tax=Gigaspora rosea TaxID=44941 RepID=A0A397VVD5_9GLOM|nr:hypothetical protein C2G38_2241234 [Gigaspora rosea]
MAQYQLSENTFISLHWKLFDSSNKSFDFSVRDIVSLTGKFFVENSEQYITVASATKVGKKGSSYEFNAKLVPLNMPHLMFNTTVTHDLNTIGETIHFEVDTKEYNCCTRNRDIYMLVTVFYPIQHTRHMVEATDVDYLRQEINYNITKNLNQTTPQSLNDLNKIADKINASAKQKKMKRMKQTISIQIPLS